MAGIVPNPIRLTAEEFHSLATDLAEHQAARYFSASDGQKQLALDIAKGSVPKPSLMTAAELIKTIKECGVTPRSKELANLIRFGAPGQEQHLEYDVEHLLAMASERGDLDGSEAGTLADLMRECWDRLPGDARRRLIKETKDTWAVARRAGDPHPVVCEDLITLALQHGEDSEPDHECGDLQTYIRAAWIAPEFTRESKFSVMCSDMVLDLADTLFEEWLGEAASADESALAFINEAGELVWGATSLPLDAALAANGLRQIGTYTPQQAVEIVNVHFLRERYTAQAERHTIEPRRRGEPAQALATPDASERSDRPKQ